MKVEWIRRYEKSVHNVNFKNTTILTGFNANIDRTARFEDLDINLKNVEPENLDKIGSIEDFKKNLKYCKENSSNQEVFMDNFNPEINGKDQLGGQGGIMANFLSKIGGRSVLYTPFLSEEISELIEPDVVYPTIDGTLRLENIEKGVNSDRTKKNYIIEFEEESCRLILSDSIRGFGPYFRKSLEEKLSKADAEINRILLSGFQDAEGNIESKLKKSRKQLEKIDIPKHLEFVSKDSETDKLMVETVLPAFTSVGLDEQELRNVAEIVGVEVNENLSLGDVFKVAKHLIEEKEISRVHVHTIKFQTAIAKKEYPIEKDKMLKGVLFGCISAASMANIGEIPDKDDIMFNDDVMHINKVDDLEEFENYFDLENFAEKGIAELEDCKVVAAPTVIHQDPKRLVGMGDLISSGAFAAEID